MLLSSVSPACGFKTATFDFTVKLIVEQRK